MLDAHACVLWLKLCFAMCSFCIASDARRSNSMSLVFAFGNPLLNCLRQHDPKSKCVNMIWIFPGLCMRPFLVAPKARWKNDISTSKSHHDTSKSKHHMNKPVTPFTCSFGFPFKVRVWFSLVLVCVLEALQFAPSTSSQRTHRKPEGDRQQKWNGRRNLKGTIGNLADKWEKY